MSRTTKEYFAAWARSSSAGDRNPSSVLRAFQSELLTALDVAEVEDRVRDGARLARTLHGERQLASQQSQAESQQRLGRMVQNVSVIVGAFGLAFTAAPTLAAPSLSLFAMAAAAGAIGVLWRSRCSGSSDIVPNLVPRSGRLREAVDA